MEPRRIDSGRAVRIGPAPAVPERGADISSGSVVVVLAPGGDRPLVVALVRLGNGHLSFNVDDIWTTYRQLVAAGVRFKSEPISITRGPNQGGWAVYFTDPDGITLEMIQRAKPGG